MKFKVGDKVRIVKNIYPNGVESRDLGIGEIHTIEKCNSSFRYPYLLDAHKDWGWCDEELELVSQEKIVITHDGKTTKATLYHGDTKTVATAKCSPEDTFDFNVGAKLAMERLMVAVEPPKYYNGKIVCTRVGVNCGLYTLGKIYKFIDGTFVADNGDEVHTWYDYERFESFEDWNRFSGSEWLEIKE